MNSKANIFYHIKLKTDYNSLSILIPKLSHEDKLILCFFGEISDNF